MQGSTKPGVRWRTKAAGTRKPVSVSVAGVALSCRAMRYSLPSESGYDALESGSAMLSRDRFSASIPNLNSAAAAISIRMAATA